MKKCGYSKHAICNIYSTISFIWHPQKWTGADRYIKCAGLSDSTHILQTALKQCEPVTYFHFTIKRLSLLNYHRPSHWFSSGNFAVNHSSSTLSNWTNLGCLNVHCLGRPFTLSLDSRNDCIGPAVSLHHKQSTIQCCTKQ